VFCWNYALEPMLVIANTFFGTNRTSKFGNVRVILLFHLTQNINTYEATYTIDFTGDNHKRICSVGEHAS
jgi:hypothetical protein